MTPSRLEGIPNSHGRIAKPFTQNPGFNDRWWTGEEKGPLAFYTFTVDGLGEVARAQIKPGPRTWVAYPSYTHTHLDSTEIFRFEVRTDLQHQGIGRKAVARLLLEVPRPCIALSLDERSDGFWQSLGWTEHAHEDAASYPPHGAGPALLFVEPD